MGGGGRFRGACAYMGRVGRAAPWGVVGAWCEVPRGPLVAKGAWARGNVFRAWWWGAG